MLLKSIILYVNNYFYIVRISSSNDNELNTYVCTVCANYNKINENDRHKKYEGITNNYSS